jgi:hypothetical protein
MSVAQTVSAEFPDQSVQVTRNGHGDLVVTLNVPFEETSDSVSLAPVAQRAASRGASAVVPADTADSLHVLLWRKAELAPTPLAYSFSLADLRQHSSTP